METAYFATEDSWMCFLQFLLKIMSLEDPAGPSVDLLLFVLIWAGEYGVGVQLYFEFLSGGDAQIPYVPGSTHSHDISI